jgi:hypothetical protein
MSSNRIDALTFLEQTHHLPPKAAQALGNTLHYKMYKKMKSFKKWVVFAPSFIRW